MVFGLLLTAFIYMAFPLAKLYVNGGRFTKNKAHKIALWNSITLGIVFYIITVATSNDGTIWNSGPALIYYWINRSILTDKNTTKQTLNKEKTEKPPNRKDTAFKIPDDVEMDLCKASFSEIESQTSDTSSSISYCRKCGAKLLEDSRFCHKCGTESVIELSTKTSL